MSVNVSEVYNAFKDYFISFDLRILAFKLPIGRDYQWINLVSSMYFSEEPVENIKKIQKSLYIPKAKNIHLLCFTDKSPTFGSRSSGLSRGGVFRIYDTITRKEEAITMGIFNPQFLQITEHPPYLGHFSEGKLLGAASDHQLLHRHKGWESSNEIEDLIISMGFDNINQWINDTLKIEGYGKGNENSFFIGLPIKGKIIDLKIKENEVTFNIKAHKHLSNLQINVYNKKEERNFYKTYERRFKLLTSQNDKNDSVSYIDKVTFNKIQPNDLIEARLISVKFPKIKIDYKRSFPPLENTLEPLINAFRKFYNLDQLKNQLLNPEETTPLKKSVRHDPSWLFEEAISWLLSIGGLSVVRLGEKEIIHLDYGRNLSADILAYKENEYLFVVDCDINHVDQKKIQNLLRICEICKEVQNEIGKPRIIPVIFIPKKTQIPKIPTIFRVIDGPQIERLLKYAINGDTEGFVTFLRQ